MALVDISQQMHAECTELNTMCLVHGDQIARLARDHAAEVVALRRKIDALESALAVAEVARAAKVVSVQSNPPLTSISFTAPTAATAHPSDDAASPASSAVSPSSSSSPSGNAAATSSAFASSQQPAVVSVESAARRINGTDTSAVQPNPPSTDDAVQSPAPVEDAELTSEQTPWDDGEASFEERMAAREFFADQAAGREPVWRRWLLKKA